jgi:hypothetical protein
MPAYSPKFSAVPHAARTHKLYSDEDKEREKKLSSQTFTQDPWRGKSRPPNAQFASGENKKKGGNCQ